MNPSKWYIRCPMNHSFIEERTRNDPERRYHCAGCEQVSYMDDPYWSESALTDIRKDGQVPASKIPK